MKRVAGRGSPHALYIFKTAMPQRKNQYIILLLYICISILRHPLLISAAKITMNFKVDSFAMKMRLTHSFFFHLL